MRIVEYLSNAGCAGVNEIADSLGLQPSTVHRDLMAFMQHGWVDQDPKTQQYELGVAFELVRTDYGILCRQVDLWLPTVVERLGYLALVGVLRVSGVAVLHSVTDSEPVGVRVGAGERWPLHATALGKAVASRLDETEMRERLPELPRLTATTITSVDAFLWEVDSVREEGYAVEDGEYSRDMRAVAVALPHARPSAVAVQVPAMELAADDLCVVGRRLRDIVAELNEIPRGA